MNFLIVVVDAVAKDIPELKLPFDLVDPQDVIVSRGQSATLRCQVKSTSTKLNYKFTWWHEGEPLNENDTRRQLLENGSLYIPKTTNKHSLEGDYRCLTRNKYGALLSNVANLKIAGKC